MSDWLQTPDAVEHVKRLLESSGAPLELYCEEICAAFAKDQDGTDGIHVRSERIVYGQQTPESPFREVDQCVTLYQEIEL